MRLVRAEMPAPSRGSVAPSRRRGVLALALVEGLGLAVALSGVVAVHLRASAILADTEVRVTSFHVESRDPVHGPLSADVVLRPQPAYRVLSPSGQVRQVSVGGTTYDHLEQPDRWIKGPLLDDRAALAQYWWEVGEDGWVWRLAGVDELPGGPAWHLRGDIDWPVPIDPFALDGVPELWIGLDGAPRSAIRFERGPWDARAGRAGPAFAVRYTFSQVNRVPAISPPAPDRLTNPDQTLVGWCGRFVGPRGDARCADLRAGACPDGAGCVEDPRQTRVQPLHVDGGVVTITGYGEAPFADAGSGKRYLTLAVEVDNRSSGELGYALALDNATGSERLAPKGELGLTGAGMLAPDQVAAGRLVYAVPWTPDPNDDSLPALLSVHVGDHDAVVSLLREPGPID